jgi:hypothetical protein
MLPFLKERQRAHRPVVDADRGSAVTAQAVLTLSGFPGDAVAQFASLADGDFAQESRGRGHHRDQYPGDNREQQTGKCDFLQCDRKRNLVHMQGNGPGSQRFQVMDDGERQQKRENRNRREANQGHIDGAVQPLTRAAMPTGVQVIFQIATQRRRRAGKVIPP